METQTKEFFEEEIQCQEDGRKNKHSQDAWIQGKDTQSGDSCEEEINRLKTLLNSERARFNEERQRANNLAKELHDAKLKLKKCEFSENDVGVCREAKQGSNASEDIVFSELLMENKALQYQLQSSQEKEALLQREMQESTALYQEVLAKLETDIFNLSEQVATLQEELDVERTANSRTNMSKRFFKMIKDGTTGQSTELKTCLQSKLDQVKEENREMTKKFEMDVLTHKKQICSLERELQDDRESHAQIVKMNQMLYSELQAENAILCQKIAAVHDDSLETQRCIQEELDQAKEANREMTKKFEMDVLTHKKQICSLEKELKDDRESHAEIVKINQMLYSELQAENAILCQKIAAVHDDSLETQRCIQEELDQAKEANREMTKKFEMDVLTHKKRICSLERELKDDRESHAEIVKINQMLYSELQAENTTLSQKMASVHDDSLETQRCIQKELDQAKDASLEMVQKFEVEILALRKEIETMEQEHRDERYRHAEVEIRNGKRAKFLHAEKNMLQKELDEVKRDLFLNEVKYRKELDASTAEIERQLSRNYKLSEELKRKDQEVIAEAQAPLPVKKPLLKKLRHALGLKKPEKWKRKQPAEENE